MPDAANFHADPEENVKEVLPPWQLLLLVLAGWVNRQQQEVIEYLVAENPSAAQETWEKASPADRRAAAAAGCQG
jgi:hypothetical protein